MNERIIGKFTNQKTIYAQYFRSFNFSDAQYLLKIGQNCVLLVIILFKRIE